MLVIYAIYLYSVLLYAPIYSVIYWAVRHITVMFYAP